MNDLEQIFFDSNRVCVELAVLAHDEALTETERALFAAAWEIASKASTGVMRSCQQLEAEAA